MSTQRKTDRLYTLEDYFSVEETAATKHEFYDGEIFAMTGASLNHNRIAANIFTALSAGLRDKLCDVFTSDMRIATSSKLYTYPDVSVFCDAVELTKDKYDTATNPTILVEVLSKPTQKYDRGQKFDQYKSIPTLREYVLIDQYQISVEHFQLGNNHQWAQHDYRELSDTLDLSSVSFQVLLAEIYRKVDFDS
ncbi:MAG: Uma2 family endonuclease [Pyrinomonadaceae bacterium]